VRDLQPDDYGLTREERIELVTHRCFVTTSKADDFFPFDDFYTLSE
jgi:hypothetical protein